MRETGSTRASIIADNGAFDGCVTAVKKCLSVCIENFVARL